MRRAAIAVLSLAAIFCAYTTFSFHWMLGSSTTEGAPRAQYNRNFWFVSFFIVSFVLYLVSRRRRAK
jgi:hypothetical protein